MTWTQPCCGCCWQAYSYGSFGEVREAHKVIDPETERCCFCGGEAEQGIYVRADPRLIPYPKEDDG